MSVILVKKFIDGHLIFRVIRYNNQLNNKQKRQLVEKNLRPPVISSNEH
jgi:hypothetical protein